MTEDVCIMLNASRYYSKTPAATSFIRQDLINKVMPFKRSEMSFGTQQERLP